MCVFLFVYGSRSMLISSWISLWELWASRRREPGPAPPSADYVVPTLNTPINDKISNINITPLTSLKLAQQHWLWLEETKSQSQESASVCLQSVGFSYWFVSSVPWMACCVLGLPHNVCLMGGLPSVWTEKTHNVTAISSRAWGERLHWWGDVLTLDPRLTYLHPVQLITFHLSILPPRKDHKAHPSSIDLLCSDKQPLLRGVVHTPHTLRPYRTPSPSQTLTLADPRQTAQVHTSLSPYSAFRNPSGPLLT